MIETIPLNMLRRSKMNARRGRRAAADLQELKASIEYHGLLHNLVVQCVLADDDTASHYEVLDGERRRMALEALAKEGRLPPDAGIVCDVLPAELSDGIQPEEISLATSIREPLHPADEVRVFVAMHKAGSTVEEIADRFGIAPLTVERRLRCGAVHGTILKAYRDGKLDFDAVAAFTLTTDRALQLDVWKVCQGERLGYDTVQAFQIKRLLNKDRFQGFHPMVRYVSIDAYEAAGGTATRDLFADEDGTGIWIDNSNLIRELAAEKLEKTAERIRKKDGWKWVSVNPEADWDDLERFGHLEPAGKDGEFTEAQKEVAGVLLSVGGNARPRQHPGLVADEDRAAAKKLKGKSRPKAKADRAPVDPATAARKEAGLSAALAEDLRIYRGSMVKVALAEAPALAADLLTFQLARQLIGTDDTESEPHPFMLRPKEVDTGPPGTGPKGEAYAAVNVGEARLHAIRDRLQQEHRDWLQPFSDDEDAGDPWATFRLLDPQKKAEVLGYVLAVQSNNQLALDGRVCPSLEAAIEAAAPPFHDLRLSKEVFWGRLSKGAILEALAECDAEWAAAVKAKTKGELAALAAEAMADPDGVEWPLSDEAKARIRAWTPAGFR